MILLELTEEETDAIHHFIQLGWLNYNGSGYAEKEKYSNLLKSVAKKTEDGLKPKVDVLITDKDLFYIKSLANNEYKKLPNETQLSNKPVEQKDLVHIALANAIIMWLNGKNLLKQLARFDHTDSSCQYEETEE